MKSLLRSITVLVAVLLLVNVAAPATGTAAVRNAQQASNFQPEDPEDFGTDEMRQSLADLAITGADYADFVIPLNQANVNSCIIYNHWDTPTDAALVTGLRNAAAVGLKQSLVLHLQTEDHQWRYQIRPADRACWNKSWNAQVMHYARIAQAEGVELYVLGAEMNSVTNPTVDPNNTRYWRDTIAMVRGVYAGKLTYAANLGAEAKAIGFVPQLDFGGVTVYSKLAVTGTPTAEKFKAAWAPIERDRFRPLYTKWQKKILILEVGYRSVDGANIDPYDPGRKGAVNPGLQKMLYQAYFGFWENISYVAGTHTWKTDVNAPIDGNTSTYTVQNKPAHAVQANWFGGVKPTQLNVWWPTANSTLTGKQPVKAMLADDRPLSSYTMQFRVNKGAWHPMPDSLVDHPHKEATTDTTSAEWQSSGAKVVEMKAYDTTTGKVVGWTLRTVNTAN